ncbi:hypothetical protein NLU13_6566 [Sarocladium strictum]|uniref:Methyltransferase n=1 Tax=Sarocladium strictum TaxID=5046 RepID=A0AA39GG53_SARSR|nr:hypothetical protein NLU13_6566 [Sarocladium strictum]
MASPKSKSSSPKSPSPPAPHAATGILPPAHWERLAGEIEDDDADSTRLDNDSSTASLASSILKYRTMNGRTYHSERGNAVYWGTVDEVQNTAQDINHHVLTLLLNEELQLAPIKPDIQKVVDIGTGTGLWAIDFADRHPSASVIGTDIAPIQPGWVPPNVEFQIEDCTQPWSFAPNSIDFVHMRWLTGSIANWYALFEEAFKSLKPGGYVESFEPSSHFESDDGSVDSMSALEQWGKFFVEGGKAIGRPFTVFDEELQRKGMEAAGFVDIEIRDFKNPVGTWPKDPQLREIGTYQRAAFDTDPEGTVLFMASQVGWTRDEVSVYLAHFRRELRAKGCHPYYRQRVAWGRKPLSSQ